MSFITSKFQKVVNCNLYMYEHTYIYTYSYFQIFDSFSAFFFIFYSKAFTFKLYYNTHFDYSMLFCIQTSIAELIIHRKFALYTFKTLMLLFLKRNFTRNICYMKIWRDWFFFLTKSLKSLLTVWIALKYCNKYSFTICTIWSQFVELPWIIGLG